MLALGVHYLRSGDAQRARNLLRAARLDGPYSETALLLHGRAWLDSDEPARARGSLQNLADRSLQFEETQEALLSLPWLFELLEDYGRAGSGYREAIRRYTEHYRYLTERSEEHTSELQSRPHLVCRLLLEKKKKYNRTSDDRKRGMKREWIGIDMV